MTPALKPCLDCGTPTHGTRCPAHQREHDRVRADAPQRRARSSARYQQARAAAKRRDNHRCQRCGATDNLEAHHLVALADGGDPYSLSNLVTLCARCHREGGTLTVENATPATPRPISTHESYDPWFCDRRLFSEAEGRYREAVARRDAIRDAWVAEGEPLLAGRVDGPAGRAPVREDACATTICSSTGWGRGCGSGIVGRSRRRW